MSEPQPTIDHDAIFKMVLRAFFAEFIDLFFPDLGAALEPDSLTFLDKEFFQDMVEPDRREADMVVQAQLRGDTALFIIHLEHQAQAIPGFDRRMFRYFSRLYDLYDVPIYPIALLSYSSPRELAGDRHLMTIGDFPVLDFRYRVVQLNRLDWHDYLANPNPLAAGLMARMRVTKTDRVDVKVACISALAELSIDNVRQKMLAVFVDTYLPLNQNEQETFDSELEKLRPAAKETAMELVTSWERRASAKTRIEVLHENIDDLLLVRFGNVDLALQQEIENITDPTLLKAILIRTATAATLDEIRTLYTPSND